MKILFFATYYNPYLKAFYANRPFLAQQSYAEQLSAIMADFFGTFSSYVLECRAQGHEAHLVIANCRPLQMQWARENGIYFDEKEWQFQLPLLQTRQLRPDIFFIGSMFQYYGTFLEEIADLAHKIVGWISCPIPDKLFEQSHPSLLITSSPEYLHLFRKKGIDAELLNAYFDMRVLDAISQQRIADTPHDLTFVGGISQAHQNRIHALKRLTQETPIELFGYGYSEIFSSRIPLLGRLWQHPIMKRYRGEAWGLDMFRLLKNSQITFNSHIDMAAGFGVNMRMYEATGMGTLLLTDGKGKQQYFTDQEVVYYSDLDDAIEKAKYFLNHEKERKAIAQAGQEHTLREYNAFSTVRKMLGYFQRHS